MIRQGWFAWEWTNGEYQPCDSVPITDIGFRLGYSAFESFAVHNGRPIFLREHLSRLVSSATFLGIPWSDLPLNIDLFEHLFPALNGIARIYITGGDVLVGGDELDSRYYVLLESKPLIDEKKYQDGWAIQLGDSAHWPVFGGRKTGSYAIQSRAYKNSQSADNVDEVLLFTESSELISGAFSNVFVIREDRFITPGVSNGARDGVIREWVCKNYEVTEQSITRDELEDIDEVFLANSRIGIMPASSINRRQLSMKMGFHIHRDYDGFVGRAFSGHT